MMYLISRSENFVLRIELKARIFKLFWKFFFSTKRGFLQPLNESHSKYLPKFYFEVILP